MNMKATILRFFQSACRYNFGTFQEEEFKKFCRMGLIFALIIGVMVGTYSSVFIATPIMFDSYKNKVS